MVRINKISIAELPQLVAVSYKGDNDLCERFHIEPNMDFGDCVNKTMELIQEAANQLKLSYYKVIYQGNAIGYVVKIKNCLYSFGVAVRFRKKEILIDFWNKIVDLMEDRFVCVLYRNNTRAIEYLQKCGMKESDEPNPEANAITLIYK